MSFSDGQAAGGFNEPPGGSMFVDGGESTMPQEQILALQGGTVLLMLAVLGWALVLRFRLMDEPASKERSSRILRVQMVAGWMVFAGAGVTVITGNWAAFGTAVLLIIALFLLLPVRPRGDWARPITSCGSRVDPGVGGALAATIGGS